MYPYIWWWEKPTDFRGPDVSQTVEIPSEMMTTQWDVDVLRPNMGFMLSIYGYFNRKLMESLGINMGTWQWKIISASFLIIFHGALKTSTTPGPWYLMGGPAGPGPASEVTPKEFVSIHLLSRPYKFHTEAPHVSMETMWKSRISSVHILKELKTPWTLGKASQWNLPFSRWIWMTSR